MITGLGDAQHPPVAHPQGRRDGIAPGLAKKQGCSSAAHGGIAGGHVGGSKAAGGIAAGIELAHFQIKAEFIGEAHVVAGGEVAPGIEAGPQAAGAGCDQVGVGHTQATKTEPLIGAGALHLRGIGPGGGVDQSAGVEDLVAGGQGQDGGAGGGAIAIGEAAFEGNAGVEAVAHAAREDRHLAVGEITVEAVVARAQGHQGRTKELHPADRPVARPGAKKDIGAIELAAAIAIALAAGQEGDAGGDAELPAFAGLPTDRGTDRSHQVVVFNGRCAVAVEDVAGGVGAANAVGAATFDIEALEGAFEAKTHRPGLADFPAQGGSGTIPAVFGLVLAGGNRGVEGVVGLGVKSAELEILSQPELDVSPVVLQPGAAHCSCGEGRHLANGDLEIAALEHVCRGQHPQPQQGRIVGPGEGQIAQQGLGFLLAGGRLARGTLALGSLAGGRCFRWLLARGDGLPDHRRWA